jgi:hypothetical protein
MTYKFQRLEVYQLALDYIDLTYILAAALPKFEEYNLKSQVIRAATSVALNIAEGSTGQSDPEQSRVETSSLDGDTRPAKRFNVARKSVNSCSQKSRH